MSSLPASSSSLARGIPSVAAARALVARGYAGRVEIRDAKTGAHRSTVNIERAAKFSAREGQRRGLHLAGWSPFPGIPGASGGATGGRRGAGPMSGAGPHKRKPPDARRATAEGLSRAS